MWMGSQEEPHTEKNTHSSSEWSLTDRRLDVDIDDKRRKGDQDCSERWHRKQTRPPDSNRQTHLSPTLNITLGWTPDLMKLSCIRSVFCPRPRPA
ncbi:hypothetical protein F2P79_004407 [Pimephales promelas]|nr:hypothetical protein F2P79_004407 [Pimephales promelas]